MFRFPSAKKRAPDVEAWLGGRPGELGSMAAAWFNHIRNCGPDVQELLHDGCPVACVGDVAFCYVNVFTSHASVGFFFGASLDDPAGLLEGSGKRMRHVKLRRGANVDSMSLSRLIEDAYLDARSR
ncbi:MAG: DUF1801 domain-containing protein [Steroidobacteraceae bacterium]